MPTECSAELFEFAASNLSSDRLVDYFAKGTHRFYVWCPGRSDYIANAEGTNAEEAQMRLYNATKAAGRISCWPVWPHRRINSCVRHERINSQASYFRRSRATPAQRQHAH